MWNQSSFCGFIIILFTLPCRIEKNVRCQFIKYDWFRIISLYRCIFIAIYFQFFLESANINISTKYLLSEGSKKYEEVFMWPYQIILWIEEKRKYNVQHFRIKFYKWNTKFNWKFKKGILKQHKSNSNYWFNNIIDSRMGFFMPRYWFSRTDEFSIWSHKRWLRIQQKHFSTWHK